MYFIIYETINLKNGRKYRGRHQTKTINDGYLGSGNWVKAAIKKYGVENFKRHDLFYAFDYDSLLWAEKEFVNKDWVEDSLTYNIVEGGGGSYTKFVDGKWVNVMQIEQSKQKRRETLTLRYPDGINAVTEFSTENNPMNLQICRDKMVEKRKQHPLGYHQGKQPFLWTEEKRERNKLRMIDNNPMKNNEVKQRKREKTARSFGFSNDQQFTNYIKDLYGVMAMTPNLITKAIGCDRSTVERRL